MKKTLRELTGCISKVRPEHQQNWWGNKTGKVPVVAEPLSKLANDFLRQRRKVHFSSAVLVGSCLIFIGSLWKWNGVLSVVFIAISIVIGWLAWQYIENTALMLKGNALILDEFCEDSQRLQDVLLDANPEVAANRKLVGLAIIFLEFERHQPKLYSLSKGVFSETHRAAFFFGLCGPKWNECEQADIFLRTKKEQQENLNMPHFFEI